MMYRPIILVLALAMFVAQLSSSSAQVTFSRDWNPGKRSNSEIQCGGPSGKTATSICHTLLAELRQVMACESRSLRTMQSEDTDIILPPLFSGRRR
ncbi:adipokinetic hormone/corazonin-related peptide-like [Arctopsyche grandis]|uniref:adipokinetic hormone/corazonin-related peptide-like n=1 Tax=Arctopsyche grandis TaxID=121162 RepID=UPI00406D98E3